VAVADFGQRVELDHLAAEMVSRERSPKRR
jgi:hypothetical protein